jgi:hypothetical protein
MKGSEVSVEYQDDISFILQLKVIGFCIKSAPDRKGKSKASERERQGNSI